MILTDLLGSEVVTADGASTPTRLGWCSDVRFLVDEISTDQPMPPARLHGIVVSPHARGTSLGFQRAGVRSPWPVAAFVGWRHRGEFLVLWVDIAQLDAGRIELRPGYQPRSAAFYPN